MLYDTIKNNADTVTTIDFSKTSANSDTNGIYMTTDTDSGSPVYYYRGSVDNHLIFANFCWKIVRTTETGGVKLIYDGKPSSDQCNNTASYTTIASVAFNTKEDDAKYVGYMYGSSIDDTANTNDSTIKGVIDTWYKNNMASYTSQLEDTVFCNDQSYVENGSSLYFSAHIRFFGRTQPTLKCQNEKDKFTVNTNNGNPNVSNKSVYLYNKSDQWLLSPINSTTSGLFGYTLSSVGSLDGYSISGAYGVRPVISLKSGTAISKGSGTATDPFIVE